jgi:hypothetical protein
MTAIRAQTYADKTDSEEPNTEYLNPNKMAELSAITSNFITHCRGNGGGIILLNGVEYLASQNDFHSVLRYFQSLNDRLPESRCKVIVPVDPKALSLQQLHLLRKESGSFTGAIDDKSWGIYLLEDPDGQIAYKLFATMINEDKEGICITRNMPGEVREDFKLPDTKMWWLTQNIPKKR